MFGSNMDQDSQFIEEINSRFLIEQSPDGAALEFNVFENSVCRLTGDAAVARPRQLSARDSRRRKIQHV